MTEMIDQGDNPGNHPGPLYYPNPYVVPASDRPDWLVIKPPYNPNSAVQKLWSQAMAGPRFVAIVFLWLTLTWWRAGTAVVIIGLLVAVLSGQGGG